MEPGIKFKTVKEYIASLPKADRAMVEELRKTIKEAAPDAEEVISYNMPAFKMNKVLVFYAAFKEHIGFYPTASPIKVFEAELKEYKTSKGAIQFPKDAAIPKMLVKRIVQFRIQEDMEKAKKKKQ